MKRFLARTKAIIVLGQEIKVRGDDDLAEASQWAAANGWHAIISSAALGPNGGLSAGVAIFARPIVGLRYPASGRWEIRRSRAVMGMVSLPGWPPLLVVCSYLHSGEGLSKANAELIADVGRALQADGSPFIWGGDFNMAPAALAASGVHSRTSSAILAATSGAVTCRTAFKSSNIDYFVVHNLAARAIVRVKVCTAVAMPPHYPVQLVVRLNLSSLQHFIFVSHAAMPRDPPYGPRTPPAQWAPALAAARAASTLAKTAPIATARAALTRAYAHFATTAESEISEVSGAGPIKRPGFRAKAPRRKLVPLYDPERYALRASSEADSLDIAMGWTWLHSNAKELLRLANDLMFNIEEDGTDDPERLSMAVSEITSTFPIGHGICHELVATTAHLRQLATDALDFAQFPPPRVDQGAHRPHRLVPRERGQRHCFGQELLPKFVAHVD